MTEHRYVLNIGSNLQPEINLPRAIELLRAHGRIRAVSSAWESEPVGSRGPNFLNLCVFYVADRLVHEMREGVVRPIESELGRVRRPNRNAPRTIDIDIMMADGKALRLPHWSRAYIVVPMAEIFPDLEHPVTHEKLSLAAGRLRGQTWIVRRPEILAGIEDSRTNRQI
jgi:2-amino-4-hydroxy-6-hydroxymethyldihydropteridine diphosphokinase